MSVHNEIDCFRKTLDNWDGEGSVKPDTRAIENAHKLVDCFELEPFWVAPLPGTEGKLYLQWEIEEDIFVECEVFPDGRLEWMSEFPDEKYEHWTTTIEQHCDGKPRDRDPLEFKKNRRIK